MAAESAKPTGGVAVNTPKLQLYDALIPKLEHDVNQILSQFFDRVLHSLCPTTRRDPLVLVQGCDVDAHIDTLQGAAE